MTIYARNCIVQLIDKEQADSFIDAYHLQGVCEGQLICLGLFYQCQLVAVMTFGYPRYNHNAAWELLRLCYKPEVVVVGGSAKLFNFFVSHNSPDNIISYCNTDLFSGDIYKQLKFVKIGQPSESFKWVKGSQWISDAQLRKYGADKLIGTTDGVGTNNEQIMLREGWAKVHYQTVQTYLWDSHIDGIIYKITNNVNKKVYIGQSRYSDNRRWNEHCSYGSISILVDKAIKKYGKENFTYEVIDHAATFYELNKKERYWIAKLCPVYNIQPGGRQVYIAPTPSLQACEAVKRYWSDPANRKKIGDVHRGSSLTQEHKEAISRGVLRSLSSPETQAKRKAASQTRKPCSKELKQHLSEVHKAKAAASDFVPTCGHRGHKHKTQTRSSISEHSKKLWQDPVYREKMIAARKSQPKRTKGSVHWFNNGEVQVMTSVCPEGFVPGKLKKGVSQ